MSGQQKLPLNPKSNNFLPINQLFQCRFLLPLLVVKKHFPYFLWLLCTTMYCGCHCHLFSLLSLLWAAGWKLWRARLQKYLNLQGLPNNQDEEIHTWLGFVTCIPTCTLIWCVAEGTTIYLSKSSNWCYRLCCQSCSLQMWRSPSLGVGVGAGMSCQCWRVKSQRCYNICNMYLRCPKIMSITSTSVLIHYLCSK